MYIIFTCPDPPASFRALRSIPATPRDCLAMSFISRPVETSPSLHIVLTTPYILMASGQVSSKMLDIYGNEFKIHVAREGNIEIL